MADHKAPSDDALLIGSEADKSQRQGECLGLRWKAPSSAVDDSGTESGEDLRLLGPEVLREIQSALSRLEGALPGLEPSRRETVTQLVNRLQSCLRIPPPSVPPIPPPRRMPNRRLLRNRHTVGVTREELADARRWFTETRVQKQTSNTDLTEKEDSLASRVFRPVRFSPLNVSSLSNTPTVRYQKLSLIRKVYQKPFLHTAGCFMEPAPQCGVLSYVEAFSKFERSLSDTGSLLDYDPSLSLFTPEQSVQIAVHKAAINKQISLEESKRRESSDDGDISSTEEDPEAAYSSVSSAQRLLQLASEGSKKTSNHSRYLSKNSKKQKIKRANTIDIPKPSHFYDISSGDEFGGASADEGNHSDHPVPSRKMADRKVPPPTFEPKTENDLKFLAFLKQANINDQSKVISYNPSARGGKHWNNRFSNIRTAFEGPEKKFPPPPNKANPAKLFWQNAQTQNQSSFRPPQSNKSHLPWSVKSEEDGVVVGSITVAKNLPGPINQFSHAPKSAFKPVEKKSGILSPASGAVKQMVAQKFSRESPKTFIKHISHHSQPPNNTLSSCFPKNVENQYCGSQFFSSSSSTAHRNVEPSRNLSSLHNRSNSHKGTHSSNSFFHNTPSNSSQSCFKMPACIASVGVQKNAPDLHQTQKSSENYKSNKQIVQQKTGNDFSGQRMHDQSLVKHPPPETYLKTHPKHPDMFNKGGTPRMQEPLASTAYPKSLNGTVVNQNGIQQKQTAQDYYSYPSKADSFYYNQQSDIQIKDINPVGTYDKANITQSGSRVSPSFNHSSFQRDREPNLECDRIQIPHQIPLHPSVSPHHLALDNMHSVTPNKSKSLYSDMPIVSQTDSIKPLFDSTQMKSNYSSNGRRSPENLSTPNVIPPAPQMSVPIQSPSFNYSSFQREREPNLECDRIQNPHQIPLHPSVSPHHLAPDNMHSDTPSSPMKTYYNNVSPKPISNFDYRPNDSSPFCPQIPKSPASVKCEDDNVTDSPYHWSKESNECESNRSTPFECKEEKTAVSKVMGQAQCQKAITVNNRTRHRFDSLNKIESELKAQVQHSAQQKALSPSFPNVLQKSESWHQIVKEQMLQAKQAPPLPKISRAKSSHSLAFPKQFEASLAPEKLSLKESTVRNYLSPTQPVAKKIQLKPTSSVQDHSKLSDDLDNVDEVFESLFQEANKKRNSK